MGSAMKKIVFKQRRLKIKPMTVLHSEKCYDGHIPGRIQKLKQKDFSHLEGTIW